MKNTLRLLALCLVAVMMIGVVIQPVFALSGSDMPSVNTIVNGRKRATTTRTVNMRSEPTKNSVLIQSIPKNSTLVTFGVEKNGYIYACYNAGLCGWVYKSYLKNFVSTPAHQLDNITENSIIPEDNNLVWAITTKATKLFSISANGQRHTLADLSKNTVVKIELPFAERSGYIRITTQQGVSGWVYYKSMTTYSAVHATYLAATCASNANGNTVRMYNLPTPKASSSLMYVPMNGLVTAYMNGYCYIIAWNDNGVVSGWVALSSVLSQGQYLRAYWYNTL